VLTECTASSRTILILVLVSSMRVVSVVKSKIKRKSGSALFSAADPYLHTGRAHANLSPLQYHHGRPHRAQHRTCHQPRACTHALAHSLP